MANLTRSVCTILILISLTACGGAVRYQVQIDSINSEDMNGNKIYTLVSGDKKIPENDLLFKEFTFYTHRALVGAGFTKAEIDSEADIAIMLTYGISDPQRESRTISVPEFGVTGYSNSTRIGNTVYHNPTYGVTGSSVHTKSYTYFKRYAELVAYDIKLYRDAKEMVPIWKTSIESVGTSGDLRRAFPVLIAAAQKYIGSNTRKKIAVNIRENDKSVLYVKGIQEKTAP